MTDTVSVDEPSFVSIYFTTFIKIEKTFETGAGDGSVGDIKSIGVNKKGKNQKRKKEKN